MAGKRINGEHSVYSSGGRWHVQGYIRGKRRRVSRARRTEALRAWKEMLAHVPPTPQPKGVRTISEAVEQWYGMNEERWRFSTRSGYRTCIDKHIDPYLGKLRVEQLTVETVEQWQHRLRRSGLSASTVRQVRLVLKQTYDQLARYGAVNGNPVGVAKNLPKGKGKTDSLSIEEARRVISAAESPHLRARWLLALSLGLRCGEVLGLRWDDLDLVGDQPHMTIAASLQYQVGRGLVLTETKTALSKRTIPLSPIHVEALKAQRAAQLEQKLAECGEFNPGNFVFTTSRGTPVDTNNDSKQWHKLLEAASVKRVRRHDARHTAATLLLASGASLPNVQRTLGHSSIQTTVDVYGHLTAADSAPFTAKVTDALAG